MDWDDITVATALGASLATVISVLLNAWWRLIDRSEADWVWDPRGTPRLVSTHDRSTNDTRLRLQPELLQAGDGTAFQVRLQGSHCKVDFLDKMWTGMEPVARLPIIPMAPPGHRVDVMISCPPEKWETASLTITWIRPPTWRKRWWRRTRKHSWKLTDISPKAGEKT